MVSFRLEAEVRAGCIEDDAELAEQVRQQSEALDATKKVTMNNFDFLQQFPLPKKSTRMIMQPTPASNYM